MILSAGIGHASNAGARITLDGLAPWLKIHSDYGVAQEFKDKRPELKIVGRWVLESDDRWREWEARGDARGFYEHYFRRHVLANRAIRFWNTGLNEDNRKLFDNADYQRLKAAGNAAALAAWLDKNYYAYVPGIDRTQFPNSESPDYPDWVKRAAFEVQIAGFIFGDGAAPVVCACSVGQPSGTVLEQRGAWRAYHAAIAAAKQYGGLIDLHVYFNVSGATEKVDSLIEHMRASNTIVPIVFGETGSEPGYRKRIREEGYTSQQFAEECVAFDNYARARWAGYVVAAFLFAANLGGWEDFDYESDEVVISRVVQHGQATRPQPGGGARAMGVDVSHHQDNNNTPARMNWKMAASRGATFAFIRASAGKLRDGDWEYNVIGATQAGLLVGAYHYLTFADNALEQARLFWSQVKTNGLALPLVADIEQEPFPTWGAAHVRAFIEEIEKLSGKKVVIYTRAGYWNYTLFGQGLESGRKLWVANYKTEKPLIPRGWTEWEFWQYTSEGDGPTYGAESVYIDQNYFNGTVEELRARYPVAAPPPSPIPQPSRVVWQDGFENGIDSWILFHVRSNSEGKHPAANVERRSTGAQPDAVRSGDAAARIIGKWICWRSGLRRTVSLTGLTPGQTCRASAWVRLWASERDDFPAEPNPEIVARATLRVVLPDGKVVEQSVSGFGWRELRTEWKATAVNETVLVNLDADLGGEENHWPVLNTVALWDDVVIEQAGTPPAPSPVPADVFPNWTHKIIIDELPVRVTPWRSGPAPRVVFTLGKGSRVEILQRDGDWGRLGLSQWIRLREGANTEARKA